MNDLWYSTFMEDLLNERRKKIIDRIVRELSKANINLYYSDSSFISALVRDEIHKGVLSQDEFEVVKDLSVKDILVLLSYHSNCC